MLQDAVVRNIGIIGEAAKQLLDVAPDFPTNIPRFHLQRFMG
jgi:uncharacterized protein with HEPN domain